MYDDKKERVFRNDGKGGKTYLKRLPQCPPPCDTCPKTEGQKERKRANACQGLSEQNQRCLQHFLECKAVGQFPDDAIVRRNAGIIQPYYQMMDKTEMYKVLGSIISMMGGKA